jgi:outer membrane protein
MKIVRVLIIIGLFVQQVKAQAVWDLKRCISYAMENNLQIKQAGVAALTSNYTYQTTKYNMLPTLNADASHAYNFGRGIDPTTNIYVSNRQIQSNSFSLSSSATLFNGGQRQYQRQVASLEWQAAVQDLKKAQNDVAMNIAMAYLNVLYTKEQAEIAARQLDLTGQQKKQTTRLVEVGNVSELSLLDVEAQYANEESNLVGAQNNFTLAKLKLIQLLQLPMNMDIQVDTMHFSLDAIKIPSADPSEVFEFARKTQPYILSQQIRLLEARKQTYVRRAAFYPSINVFGSIRTSYSSAMMNYVPDPFHPTKINFTDQITQNYGKALGMSLSMPIFNGMQTHYSFQKARLGELNANYNLQSAELSLQQEVTQAIANWKAAVAKFESVQKYATSMQAAYDANSKKLNAGIINTLEFNTAKNNLAKSQSDLVSAKYDLLLKTKIVDFYLGRPLY